ncbi:MAG: LysE family translocator [Desulfobulbaceae bacterium]|nr:LysE family translocator [Desulfobulbaceae bacterium]
MTIESWIMYLALVTAATATPGPAVLFIITNSTLHGWKKASWAAFGNIAGLLLLGTITISGLSTLLLTSLLFFTILKFAGAAYLIYLGLRILFQKTSHISSIEKPTRIPKISSQKIFIQAFTVAISNPKAVVFLTALFPQFINVDGSLLPQFSVLIITLMAFSFFFLMAYALLAQRIKYWLDKPERVKIFSRASGATFIGFGLLLATSSNSG